MLDRPSPRPQLNIFLNPGSKNKNPVSSLFKASKTGFRNFLLKLNACKFGAVARSMTSRKSYNQRQKKCFFACWGIRAWLFILNSEKLVKPFLQGNFQLFWAPLRTQISVGGMQKMQGHCPPKKTVHNFIP